MKVNNVKMLCNLGYIVAMSKEEKIIWWQKHIKENIRKDIMINFESKWVHCETFYYSTTGTLRKKESMMTFEEFDLVKEILAEGEDEIFKDKYDRYGNITY